MTEKKNTSKLQEISYNLTSEKDYSPDLPHLHVRSPTLLKQSEVTIQSSPLSSSMNKVNWESSPQVTKPTLMPTSQREHMKKILQKQG